jgi:maleylpyruvate isomerase
MEPGLAERIEQVREAERRLLAGLEGMQDADMGRASLCPGWTAGHLLTHVARSADALRRAVDGARRGELVPMYASPQAREADIDAGAGRPTAELAADDAGAAERLHQSWEAVDPGGWDRPVPHRLLGQVPVRGTVALRWFEVEIHHVDLDRGYRPADWPPPFVSRLLKQVVPTVAGRLPDGVPLALHATDSGERWSCEPAGPGGRDAGRPAAPVTVSGPSWAIGAWLIGRGGPAIGSLSVTGGDLPALAPWL